MAQAGNFSNVWKHVNQQHNTAETQFQSFLSSQVQVYKCIFMVRLPYF